MTLFSALAADADAKTLTVEDVFSTYVYKGTGAALDVVNGIDLAGEGGMVWIKSREEARDHDLFDTERGVGNRLNIDTNPEAYNSFTLQSFNDDGFSIGTSLTDNKVDMGYVLWSCRKAPKFFDIVKYTGNGVAGREIAHDLGVSPGMLWSKSTSTVFNWIAQHRSLPASDIIYPNLTNASITSGSYYDSTKATDTVFTVGSAAGTNANGVEYIAYLFAHDPDPEGMIQCGSYTGNGLAAGPEIDLGWEPQYVLIKIAVGATGNWCIFDTARGIVTNGNDSRLVAQVSDAETDSGSYLSVTPTGFKINMEYNDDVNKSGYTYIYMAIRRPMRTPESASEVFAIDQGDSSNPEFYAGFEPDMAMQRGIALGISTNITARLMQGKNLLTASTAAETTSSSWMFDYMNSWYSGPTNSGFYSWMWKRAAGFFDVVCYTGDGVAGKEVTHNLGVVPEMIWVKRRSGGTEHWGVYNKTIGATKYMYLSALSAAAVFAMWDNTPPTETVFTVGTDTAVNTNTNTYIAYLFATLEGISKVGSFSHTLGTPTDVPCGFAAGARMVIAKRTDATGPWYTWDSVRGIVAGDDPYLLLNDTAAQVTNTDYIDQLAEGFTTSATFPTGDYIFYAVA